MGTGTRTDTDQLAHHCAIEDHCTMDPKCPNYQTCQSTVDAVAVELYSKAGEEFNELLTKVREIHEFITGFAAAMSSLQANPMARVMLRQLGVKVPKDNDAGNS